jgi:predicted 3-demethylubiquinone-9 3-methyltransferase (glyoxalase superfamily)
VSLEAFPDAWIVERSDYIAGADAMSGKVRSATLSIAGTRLRIIDSPVPHGFSFTPAVSLYVELSDEATIFHAFETLAKRGTVLLPIYTYPHSPTYGWLTDRFGVSWQLSQPDLSS